LEEKTFEPDFWNNPTEATKINRELNHLKNAVARYNKARGDYEDLEVSVELLNELPDDDLEKEAEQKSRALSKELENIRLETLLSGPYDMNNALLTIHAGAGGTEAQDWAEMLLRMYTRYCESRGFTVRTLDFLAGDEAGVKSATLEVSGDNAYGYLKSEKGVHRLVRMSPFDASGKRHTSFTSVMVMPVFDDDIEIDIRPEDLRVDTYRSSGAGGQHVNKTSSAIRITHLPTGIVVQCQNERSQIQNREMAMKMLKARLMTVMLELKKEHLDEIKGNVSEIGWGNQIRSYVFQPYTLVKDHRTGEEIGNIQSVMDGGLDKFINAYLTWQALGAQ